MEKQLRRFFFSVYVQDIFAVPLAKLLIKVNFKANYVTLIGLILSILSGVLFINNAYYSGAIMFFSALICDSTDGRVARGTNTFSSFGALLDSVADKIRSFFVAFCLIYSFELPLFYSILLFIYYIFLPVIRFVAFKFNSEFYDPTILFWDASPFKNWFVKKKILGFYTGWERSVLALCVAPLFYFKLEIFLIAILIEQIIFLLGILFFKNYKVGLKI